MKYLPLVSLELKCVYLVLYDFVEQLLRSCFNHNHDFLRHMTRIVQSSVADHSSSQLLLIWMRYYRKPKIHFTVLSIRFFNSLVTPFYCMTLAFHSLKYEF